MPADAETMKRVETGGAVALVLSGGFILFLILLALFAPLVAPVDPLEQDLLLEKLPPAWSADAEPGYWLGTDSLGRDVLSRLIHGARTALIVAFLAASAAALLGSVLGLMAGFFRGWVDTLISRAVDVWMSFPPVLLSILLVAVLGTGLHSVVIAIAVIDWTRFCRVIRTETLAQRAEDYVDAARIVGLTRWQTLWREILPNVWPTILVLLSLEMGIAVIVEAILSFVGLSVASDTPTWGGMIAEGRQVIHYAWWVLVFPLGALCLTVLAFNRFGDALRRQVDPVLRR
ncbi:MAG: ABC transporter permease [Minwuia sp.]|uniref:ABC transporter permease n=1 Tax=Minwuia sp. TaxID=2493630 RepID=UPI003A8383AC